MEICKIFECSQYELLFKFESVNRNSTRFEVMKGKIRYRMKIEE